MNLGWVRRAIATKRDGGTIDPATWADLIAAYVAGAIDDAPMAALTMACAIRGMEDAEIFALTDAMVRSGETLAYAGTRIVVDKHSSGGVGDSISLAVVPLVAACGVRVAKLSGRALGHTGGTLDKLEAIPGVRTDIEPAAFVAQVERIGCAIAAQSARLVPADQRLYALRDRTGSVPSLGLIAASIVAKKIAGGAGAIVFDVKVGRGAFMRTPEAARALAEKLVLLATRAGRRASALVTDMDEPLAPNVGTGVEAVEARDFLQGRATDARLTDLARVIAHEMLRIGGVPDAEIAPCYDAALASGAAYEKLVELVEAQGGSRAALEQIALDSARTAVPAARAGIVSAIDAVAVGEIARDIVTQSGPFAGIRLLARVGTRVVEGDVLAEIVGSGGVATTLSAAFTIGDRVPTARPLVEAIVRDAVARAASNDGMQ